MKVLYIATSFPKPSKGATIYTDLAETLKEAGHEIVVAVSEQKKDAKTTKLNEERDFEVLRIVTGNYYDVGYIEKGITTLKTPKQMKNGIKKYLRNYKFDFILFESPPVTNASLVEWAKKYFDCPAYLMLKDIFPQNAVDINIVRNKGLLHRFFLSKEKKLLKTADHIGCMSVANKKYILKHNAEIESSKVEIFPNTKKVVKDINVNKNVMREKLEIPNDSCVFLFGGNMGRPQNIDLICEIILNFKDDNNLFFLFVGRGTDRHKLEKTIKDNKIQNALVIENLPRNDYEQITKECDIGLVVLDPRFTIPNFPSRILSYMEYAKPFIALTDKSTDLKDLIEEANCGMWAWSGDTEDVIKKIKEIATSTELNKMGSNGRKFLMNNFNIKSSVNILEGHFEK